MWYARLVHVEHVDVQKVKIVIREYLCLYGFTERVKITGMGGVSDPDPTVLRFEFVEL